MRTTTTRTLIAAITALAVAVPGATAVAQAAPAKPLTGTTAKKPRVAKPKPRPKAPTSKKRVRHTKRAPGAPLTTIVRGGTVVAVTAGATGDGPANQRECDSWAGVINSSLENAENALIDGNEVEADIYLESVEANTDAAMSRGCFLLY